MKSTRKILAVSAGLVLTASMAACNTQAGGGSTPGGNAGGGEAIKIGIKFDQPGLGLKEGSGYSGFDVEVAKYVAKEMGYDPAKIQFVETPSAQRETMLQGDQVKMIFATYSITDARKQKVSFGGPYFIAGQDLLVKTDSAIGGPETMNGKKLCSVAGSTPAKNIKDKYAKDVQLQEYDTYSKCVEALASGAVDAVTTDNVILAGYAAQPQYKGKLKVVGKPFSTEKYGVGVKKGDTETCTKVNTAIEKMVSSGEWKKALEKTVGASGFEPDSSTNPPKPEGCS
ncbi:glutamate ABC transporter substrate-binding protein [Mariniluteicoccus endophyticus]